VPEGPPGGPPAPGDGPIPPGPPPGVPTGFSGMLSDGVAGKLGPLPPPKSDRPSDELVMRGDDKSGNGDDGIFTPLPPPTEG